MTKSTARRIYERDIRVSWWLAAAFAAVLLLTGWVSVHGIHQVDRHTAAPIRASADATTVKCPGNDRMIRRILHELDVRIAVLEVSGKSARADLATTRQLRRTVVRACD